jgi:predicted RNase H-like HicB family nuclease
VITSMEYPVIVSWDTEARVWYAVCDDIPLTLESNSFDALIERVKIAAHEILELNTQSTASISLSFQATRWESIA